MTSTVNNMQSNAACNLSFKNIIPNVVLVAGIALSIIGILAAFGLQGLNVITPYWYLFELAAIGCFIFKIICCCRDCAATHNTIQTVPRMQGNDGTTTTVQHPKVYQALSPADQLFVQGQNCVQRKDFVSACNYFNQAWSSFGHVLAGFALAECLEQDIGIVKNDAAANQIYRLLANNNRIEAVFACAENEIKAGNLEVGVKWLEHAISVDYESSRVIELKQALHSSEQTPELTDPHASNNTATQLLVMQINASNKKVIRATQLSFLGLTANHYRFQEKSRREAAVNQLMNSVQSNH